MLTLSKLTPDTFYFSTMSELLNKLLHRPPLPYLHYLTRRNDFWSFRMKTVEMDPNFCFQEPKLFFNERLVRDAGESMLHWIFSTMRARLDDEPLLVLTPDVCVEILTQGLLVWPPESQSEHRPFLIMWLLEMEGYEPPIPAKAPTIFEEVSYSRSERGFYFFKREYYNLFARALISHNGYVMKMMHTLAHHYLHRRDAGRFKPIGDFTTCLQIDCTALRLSTWFIFCSENFIADITRPRVVERYEEEILNWYILSKYDLTVLPDDDGSGIASDSIFSLLPPILKPWVRVLCETFGSPRSQRLCKRTFVPLFDCLYVLTLSIWGQMSKPRLERTLAVLNACYEPGALRPFPTEVSKSVLGLQLVRNFLNVWMGVSAPTPLLYGVSRDCQSEFFRFLTTRAPTPSLDTDGLVEEATKMLLAEWQAKGLRPWFWLVHTPLAVHCFLD